MRIFCRPSRTDGRGASLGPQRPDPRISTGRTGWVSCATLFLATLGMAPFVESRAEQPIVEAMAPIFDTRVTLLESLGKMEWLDADTLAITTAKTASTSWWEGGQVVAAHVGRRTTTPLFESAYLNCANPAEGLLGVAVGSYAQTFSGNRDVPPPREVFYRWRSADQSPAELGTAPMPPWNWYLCRKTAPEHLREPMLGFIQRHLRYLESGDGVLVWQQGTDLEALDRVWLRREGKADQEVKVGPPEISAQVPFLPYANRYLLSAGQYAGDGTSIQYLGRSTNEIPVTTMSRAGEVERAFLPDALRNHLQTNKVTQAGLFPAAPGLLVIVPEYAKDGGGLYLASSGEVRKIWCREEGQPKRPTRCRVEDQLKISPDGCKIAFIPREVYPKTVKIVEFCSR